jgi:hypothetical protein
VLASFIGGGKRGVHNLVGWWRPPLGACSVFAGRLRRVVLQPSSGLAAISPEFKIIRYQRRLPMEVMPASDRNNSCRWRDVELVAIAAPEQV